MVSRSEDIRLQRKNVNPDLQWGNVIGISATARACGEQCGLDPLDFEPRSRGGSEAGCSS
jgi:hypothetical protein